MLRSVSVKVTALTAALTAGAGLALIQLAGVGPVGRLDIPAWGIAVGYFAAETLVIQLPSRHSAHSVSLSEVPLAVGLVALSPTALVAAVVIPSAIALLIVRRQAPIKAAFNLAIIAAGSTLAAVIVHTWGSWSDPRMLWLVLFAALTIQAIFTSLMVATAIILTDRQQTIRNTLVEIVTSTTWSLFGAYLGTMLAAAWTVESLTAYMLAGLIGAGVLALQNYGRLNLRHIELESLHAITRAVEPARNVDDVVEIFVGEVADRLRVRHLWMAYGDSQIGWRAIHHQVGKPNRTSDTDPQLRERIHRLAVASTTETRSLLPAELSQATGEAVISPISVGDELFGVVVAVERTGPDALTDSDREFLRTMVGHLGSLLGRSLAEAHLLAENEDKKRIIRSKDQLIAAVSHELRTPLTGILGFSELLRDSDALTDLASCEMVEFIADQATDLAHIVEDLLTASRVELDALIVDLVPTEIDELVRSTVASLTVREDRAFEQHLEPAVASVDQHRLRQVVRNLLTNAYRYGGYSVRVAVRATSSGAVIEVGDDGEGIGDTDPETIFEPYGSVHPQSPSQPGSMGLGLTISRRLIRKMGGDITYHRADGWTTFSVQLPGAPEPSEEPPVDEPSRHSVSRPNLAATSHDSRANSPG